MKPANIVCTNVSLFNVQSVGLQPIRRLASVESKSFSYLILISNYIILYRMFLRMFTFNLFILFLFSQILSCQNSGHNSVSEPYPNKTISASNLEMILYSEIIDSLIDYDFYFLPPPSINSLKKSSSQTDLKNKGLEAELMIKSHESESRLNVRDTIKKYLFIHESLISLEEDYNDIKIFLLQNNLINDFPNLAPRHIFEDTIADLDYLSEQISTLLITGLVEDKEDYKDKFGIRYGKLYLGNIILSRVLFNKNNSKACFFYSFAAGGSTGEHSLVYVEMRNKKWVVVDKVTMSVM